MKIIKPSVELVGDINQKEILKKIELCGRVSHQSQPRDDSAEQFVRMLIKRGHESVLEHVSLTFHIITDRAIQNELVRHRLASPTVESTRYVKYNELEVINPSFNEENYYIWLTVIKGIENFYRTMVEHGATPEQARSVLPQCLKSELYLTANLREWRHIIKMRTDKAAHPQMRQIAEQIFYVFKSKLPVLVEDIKND